MHKSIKTTIYYCLGILLVAVLFQIVSVTLNQELFFPSFDVIVKDLFKLLADSKTYLYLWNTLKHLIISVLISAIIGYLLGVIAGINKWLYIILKPLMTFLRTLPIIIFIVILMLFMKFQNVPITTCILILVPIFYEGAYQGVSNLDSTLLDVYKLNSNISLKVIWRVHLPLISSYSKSSLINAIGMGIKILVTTEYIAGVNDTIGKAITHAMYNLEYSHIYAYSFILIILIVIVESLPNLITKIYEMVKYKPGPLKK